MELGVKLQLQEIVNRIMQRIRANYLSPTFTLLSSVINLHLAATYIQWSDAVLPPYIFLKS